MDRSWKVYVANLCGDAWNLNPHRTQRVIEGIDFLVASDQLTDMTVAEVLASIGMRDPGVSEAARSIRQTIRGSADHGSAISGAL
jgi:hypothetical protein